MKKIFIFCFLLSLPSLCAAQVTLEWMHATPKKRKEIEQRDARVAQEELERALYRAAAQEEGQGARLGLGMSGAVRRRMWDERVDILLPLPDPQRADLAQMVPLRALRLGKSWNLTTRTAAILLRGSAYNYRLDFEKLNGADLFARIVSVQNKGPAGARVYAEFFVRPLGSGRYGLFVRGVTQPVQEGRHAEPEESLPVQIGVIRK